MHVTKAENLNPSEEIIEADLPAPTWEPLIRGRYLAADSHTCVDIACVPKRVDSTFRRDGSAPSECA